jgi:hypothetical protein
MVSKVRRVRSPAWKAAKQSRRLFSGRCGRVVSSVPAPVLDLVLSGRLGGAVRSPNLIPRWGGRPCGVDRPAHSAVDELKTTEAPLKAIRSSADKSESGQTGTHSPAGASASRRAQAPLAPVCKRKRLRAHSPVGLSYRPRFTFLKGL